MRIDLHTHSSVSDGTDSPPELLAAARAAGLDVVALTDHDTTAGWVEAQRSRPDGLTVVPGMELSCRWFPAGSPPISVHLLAYLFDPADAALAAELARTRDDRVTRAREMVARLAVAGYDVTSDELLAQAGTGATVGRPLIVDVLVANGVVRDRGEAFAGVLHSSSPYYVRHYAADPVRIVELVREAGGVTVFAHPRASARGRTVGDEMIASLAAAGLAGLEVDHPDHDEGVRAQLCALAADLGLLVTGASDYHGLGKPQRMGAETTAPEVYAELVARASGSSPLPG